MNIAFTIVLFLTSAIKKFWFFLPHHHAFTSMMVFKFFNENCLATKNLEPGKDTRHRRQFNRWDRKAVIHTCPT
jgi:hypothetical protein